MFPRKILGRFIAHLDDFASVAILGPRQIGKTTLALEIAAARPSVYLDAETPTDRKILLDPVDYLRSQAGKLVIIDEVQRVPDLFSSLRGVIDARRRSGENAGHFLLLGSASRDLLQQTSESLAGRIIYEELTPLLVDETASLPLDQLWLRGGFPGSLLARSGEASLTWRRNFITQYLERDIPLLGIRTPTETMRRLWTMLATAQGCQFNASHYATNLGVSPNTISSHVDMLCDLMLVRRLQPWFVNTGKRLVKSPKLYWRDSGIHHALLGIPTQRDLLSHITLGASWEAFVTEQLICASGPEVHPWYYRTAAGAEIDLLLEVAPGRLWAVEVKHSSKPVPSKGFHLASADVGAERRIVIYTGSHRYADSSGVEYMPLPEAITEVRALMAESFPHTKAL
jgi:uncharacterized protein